MSKHSFFKRLQENNLDYDKMIETAKHYRSFNIFVDLLPKCAQRTDDAPPWEVLTIAQHAEMQFIYSDYFWTMLATYDVENREYQVLSKALEDFSMNINMPLWDAKGGLPLYVSTGGGNLLPLEEDEDGRFVLRYIEEGHFSDSYSDVPSWAKKIYMKNSECRAWDLFYSDRDKGTKRAAEARKLAVKYYVEGHQESLGTNQTPASRREDLGTREKRTLLVIIGALAKHANIDIDKPEKAGQIISKLTETLGAAVDHQTITNKLKELPDAIQARTK